MFAQRSKHGMVFTGITDRWPNQAVFPPDKDEANTMVDKSEYVARRLDRDSVGPFMLQTIGSVGERTQSPARGTLQWIRFQQPKDLAPSETDCQIWCASPFQQDFSVP